MKKDILTSGVIMLLLISQLLIRTAIADDTPSVPTLQDFAYGVLLKTEGEGAIYQTTLSEAIYRHLTRDDWGDIRIFNGEDEVVPHTLRLPESESVSASETLSLPFFPIYETDQKDTSKELSLYFSTNKEGVILRANTAPDQKPASAVTAYLIDASSIERPIDKLHLKWQDTQESFVASVSMAFSNDLTHWQSLIEKATIAEMRYGGHRLEQQRLSLPHQHGKYLRLSWESGKEGVLLTQIQATLVPSVPEPEFLQMQITGHQISENPLIYEFSTRGRYPVQRLNVQLPQRNSLVQGILKSRHPSDTDWRNRYQKLFYHLQIQGTTLTNDALSVPLTTDPYWRLEISPRSGGLGSGMPVLEVSWIPHKVLFLARGEPPFRLAYGSIRVKQPERPMDMLFNMVNHEQKSHLIQKAYLGEQIQLGGEAVLNPPPPPFPWRQTLLWSVLILGVLILGWMAWHLYNQMKSFPDV